jgi:putative salt-induced outer membrane protein YdiY
MRYQAGRHRIISSTAGALAIKDDAQYINKLFSHLRHQVFAFDWFAWETWVQGAENQFTRLNLRVLAGTGPRFDIVRDETLRLAIGIHYMLEFERISADGAAPDESLEEQNHRSNAYLSFAWDIIEDLSIQETIYAQPKLDDPVKDFRLANEIQLTAKVTKHFGLGTSFQMRYDHAAPAHVRALDTVTLATLTAGF